MIRAVKHIIRPFWNRITSFGAEIRLLRKSPTLKLGDRVLASQCEFGERVYLASGTVAKNTRLGDFSYCGEGVKLANVSIGRFTCIGPGVTIGLGGHPLKNFASIHPAFYSTAAQVGKTFTKEQHYQESPPPTHIGNDVWIGAGVIIPGGVSVGDGAVVASGAVVVKDVLPYEIVGGVPAKRIKMRFDADTVKSLLKVKWWDWPLEKIERQAAQFLNVKEFIKQ